MTLLTKYAIKHEWSLPLESLTFRSMFQGAAVAEDPRDKKVYLWILQVKATGPGDVEDIYAHRFRFDANGLTPLDTMIVKRAGHVQSLRVRISIKGNPWLWMGCETYDAKGKTTGYQVRRILHRRGTVKLDSSDHADIIYTGSGSAQVIGSEKNIWLRRPSSPEVYEEHLEETLVTWPKGSAQPKPIRVVRMPRLAGHTYQSACASPEGEILRVNGATEDDSILTSSMGPVVDFTAAAPAGLRVTSEEPEGVYTWKGQVYAVKRFNSVQRRVVAAFAIG